MTGPRQRHSRRILRAWKDAGHFDFIAPKSREPRLLHFYCAAFSAASTVCAISVAMVMGPTPPGTGV